MSLDTSLDNEVFFGPGWAVFTFSERRPRPSAFSNTPPAAGAGVSFLMASPVGPRPSRTFYDLTISVLLLRALSRGPFFALKPNQLVS